MLLNLTKHQWSDVDQMYLYVKDPVESKYQLLFNGRENVEIKKLKNPKALIILKQLMIFMKIQDTIIQQRKGKC